MFRKLITLLAMTVVIGTCHVSAGSLPDDSRIEKEWGREVFGWAIGVQGMFVGDVDADNVIEIVAAAHNSRWYIVEFEHGDYVHEWASPIFFGEQIDRLVVEQLDSDAALEVLIAIDGELLIYDGKTRELESELQAPTYFITSLELGQLDGDPAIEAVICDHDETVVLDLVSGEVQLTIPDIWCDDLAVGETDGSPGKEIVITGRDGGFVLDGMTGEIEWEHEPGFGDMLALGDLDGDNLDEISAGFAWSPIQIWNGDSREMAWQVEPFNISAITTADVEGDGSIELLYGDNQQGGMHVLDGLTGSEKWSVPNPRHGVDSIAVGDVDDDDAKEIIFGVGDGSTGEDNLIVVDSVSQSIEWMSQALKGPFNGLAHGDIDADSQPEFIYTTQDHGDTGLYFIHDAKSKELEYQSPESSRGILDRIYDIHLANIDNDPAQELFILTSRLGDGRLQCIDGLTHEVQWEKNLDSNQKFAAVWVGDLDDDGNQEIVTSTDMPYGNLDLGPRIYVFDADSTSLEWESEDLGSFFGAWAFLGMLRVADIDNDNVKEILVARNSGALMAVDSVNATTDLALPDIGVTAFEITDIDGDQMPDIIIGNYDGEILRIDPETGGSTLLAGPFEGEINGLSVKQLAGDSSLDFVFASANRLYLVDGATGVPLWVSQELGRFVGYEDTVLVDDIDQDGNQDIWANTGWGHVIYFIDKLLMKSGFDAQ